MFGAWKTLRKRVLLAAAAAALSASGAWAASGELDERPLSSTGDISFTIDSATYRSADGGSVEEIYCAVPNPELKFIGGENGLEAKGRMKIRLVPLSGTTGGEETFVEREFTLRANSLDETQRSSILQIVQSRTPLKPGSYSLRAEIEDKQARKRGILYLILGTRKKGIAEGAITVKGFAPDSLSLSDLEFARSVRAASAEGGFSKFGIEIVPNPSRFYGLLLPEAAFYLEVYDLRPGLGASPMRDSLETVYTIVDGRGATVFEQTKQQVSLGEMWTKNSTIDISSLSSGTYLLGVEVRDGLGNTLAHVQRPFEVIWSVFSWGKQAGETLDELKYIATEDELRYMATLGQGDRERYLREFWRRHDPTGDTIENEIMEEHYRRVAYANQQFSSYEKGMLTDRGRIYIKYGPPDEAERGWATNPFVMDLEQPSDGWVPESGTKILGRDAEEVDREETALRDAVGKAYEIWTYSERGARLDEASDFPKNIGMRFVFVDRSGFGNYVLIYDSESGMSR